MAKILRKKKTTRQVPHGRIYIYSSFNNTIISLTDETGNALGQVSSGALGFKGTKKSTPYAAQLAMKEIISKAKNHSVSSIDILISGVGAGRESAVRALHGSGIQVKTIKDITPLPHNGTRAKKPRKV